VGLSGRRLATQAATTSVTVSSCLPDSDQIGAASTDAEIAHLRRLCRSVGWTRLGSMLLRNNTAKPSGGLAQL
jgi:hypothetical protein